MAKYRSLEPVTYVADGKVISVAAERLIDLTDAQAEALAGKVASLDGTGESMFPTGAPVIAHVITRDVPLSTFTADADPGPVAPAKAKPAEKPTPSK